MTTSTEPTRSGSGRAAGLLVAGLVLAAACAAWWPMLDLALLGWDTYPLIAASEVSSWGEFWGTFNEELMDGRYPLGHFWRPVTHLAFALDHALWGLDPFGYHLTDLVLLALSACLLAGLSGRLFGGSSRARWSAGLVAGLVFAWHPVQFEILTAAPRRADALAVYFSIWALFCHARDPLHPSTLRRAGVALLCALALASKEAGVVAVVAVVLCSLCARAPGDGAEQSVPLAARVRRALLATWLATWPALAAVGATLAVRTAALGGLGGSQYSSTVAGWTNAWPLVQEYARGVLVPANVSSASGSLGGSEPLWALAVVLAVTALASVALRARADAEPEVDSGAALHGGGLFLLLWTLALIAITGMSGIAQGWYALPFVAVFALALGLMVTRGLTHLATRPALAVPGLLVAAVGLGVSLMGSGFFDRAEDFRAVSKLQRRFLRHFEQQVEAAPPDATIQLEGCPADIFVTRGNVLERTIYALAPYSLEAYAELALGGRQVRVFSPTYESTLPPQPGEVRVRVIPQPLRFGR